MESCRILTALVEGDFWRGASALAGAAEGDFERIARALAEELGDAREVLDLVGGLVSPGDPPAGLDVRGRMVAAEAMRLLSVDLALGLAETNWRDLTPCISALCGDESTFRVREAAVGLLIRIASSAFEESRTFWVESLVEADSHLAAAAIKALGSSDVPVLKVLDLLETVIDDTRKAVREAICTRALPELGRRDPQAVYTRLGRWVGRGDEIARWNVARALSTALGGVYVERAMEILEALAADERPMVWRAAAAALIQIAQRRPAFVLPVLARWRSDEKRRGCALLALETLAHR